MKRMLSTLAAVAAALAANTASAQYQPTLHQNQAIQPGQTLTSQNGKYFLTLQATDRNLVEYRAADMKPIWTANIANKGGAFAVMQTDGNFVVYDGATPAHPVWNSQTGGHFGSSYNDLTLGDDGSMKITTSAYGTLWSSAADPCPNGGSLGFYPACMYGMNSFVVACSVQEAYQRAFMQGGSYGYCPYVPPTN